MVFFIEYRLVFVLTSKGLVEFCIRAENFNYTDFAKTFLYVREYITDADRIV